MCVSTASCCSTVITAFPGDCFVGLGTPFLGKGCSGGEWRSELVVITTSSLEQLGLALFTSDLTPQQFNLL
jgi:hypothetical protein